MEMSDIRAHFYRVFCIHEMLSINLKLIGEAIFHLKKKTTEMSYLPHCQFLCGKNKTFEQVFFIQLHKAKSAPSKVSFLQCCHMKKYNKIFTQN